MQIVAEGGPPGRPAAARIAWHSMACANDVRGLREAIELAGGCAGVNAPNRFGMAPLHGAIFHGHRDMVVFLIEACGASIVQTHGVRWTTPMHLAAVHAPHLVEYLLARSPPYDAFLVDWGGSTPKATATRASNEEAALQLEAHMLAVTAAVPPDLPKFPQIS